MNDTATATPGADAQAPASPPASAPRTNAARRLHTLFSTIVDHDNGGKPMLEVWGIVSRPPGDSGPTRHEDAARAIVAAIDDARRLRLALSGVDDTAFHAPFLAKVDMALDASLANISNHWGAARAHLTPDVLTALHYMARSLPNDDLTLEDTALGELFEIIDSVRREAAGDQTLSQVERDRLDLVLIKLVAALRAYRAGGQEALQAALRDWVSMVMRTYRNVDAAPGEKSRLVRVYQAVNEKLEPFVRADNVLTAGARFVALADLGWKLLGG